MAGKAKSLTKKAQIISEEKDALYRVAAERYNVERAKPDTDKTKLSSRQVCKAVSEEHKQKTHREVLLNHQTVINRSNGMRSIAEFNASKSWMGPEEREVTLKFAVELAERGIPLTPKTLREYVDFILREKFGPDFPGVGKNWIDRFLEKHSDRIKTFFSSPLERSRANGVNAVTHAMFFELLSSLIKEFGIEFDCIYAADETGFMPGRGCTSKVIGKAGQKSQHRKESGNRSIISVMPTICADGTSIPPLVIFSGTAYSVSWKQDNPLNASIGYQKKGYMDGELGIDWIKHFDLYTKRKAGRRHRLLVVDAHRSRLTLPFLQFCKENNIHVCCYPSHSTHVYQGLDVVIFGILKQCFSNEMLKFESSTGQAVCKENFLSVYTPAHLASFTPENIRAAFAKTGIHPFNPDAIKPTQMKPSIESSCSGDGLPLPQPSPVRAVAGLLKVVGNIPKSTANHTSHTAIFGERSRDDIPIDPVLLAESQLAVQQLSKTSGGFLLSSSPVKASASLPFHVPSFEKPLPIPDHLLSLVPENKFEEQFQDELERYVRREAQYFSMLTGLRASLVLQSIYCERLRSQLFAKEKKTAAPKGSGRLACDGLPRCLTADDFVEKVREFVQRQLAEAAEKERRKGAKEEYLKALEEWNKSEESRKAAKELRKAAYAAELKEWEAERDLAKREHRRARWKKPTLGKLPRAPPKPKMAKVVEDSEWVDIGVVEGADSSIASDENDEES